VPDSLYCHKCGASISDKSSDVASQQNTRKPDYSSIGLLLIKIGAILSFVMPFAIFAGVGGVVARYSGFFDSFGGFFLGAFIPIVVIGIIFGVIALRFQKDIAAGRSERIVHAIILGVAMFVLGSNVAGALVGIGAFLCYISPSINKKHP
jgi:hypothetical protein